MTLILTLVRHGESTDNLKSLWAGHRDAPLTTHGMNQARRLGKSLESEPISKIYASDLKRAHWTAIQIAVQNRSLLNALLEEEEAAEVAPVQGSASQSSLLSSPLKGKLNVGHEKSVSSSPSNGRRSADDRAAAAGQEGEEEEGEDEEEIAEETAGPSSMKMTDRADYAPSTAEAEEATLPLEYLDDFTSSSSAAASSPIPSPSSSSSPRSSSSSTSPSSLQARLSKTVTTTPLLREQFFGLAEGQNWRTGYATSSNSHHNRGYKFEQGESLEDVHARAVQIMQRCVVPWLVRSTQSGRNEHVVLVAHGIMISELLFALSRLQDSRAVYVRQSGHTNTGWTRLVLSFPSPFSSSSPASAPAATLADPRIPSSLTSPSLPPLYSTFSSSSSSSPSNKSQNAPNSATLDAPVASLPPITLRKTHTNITVHLDGLRRTKGGVGSEQFDARQKSLKDFFSGGSTSSSAPADEEIPAATPGGAARGVPDPKIVDLTNEDDGCKTNGGNGDGSVKRGIRIKSPISPSPKKGRLD